jgi:DNA-binding response OmpR family regulator
LAEILIIEDDRQLRRIVSTTLKEAGFAVLEASNGRIALQILEGRRPLLVITDVLMPGMDGIETIREIRRKGSTIKILATSGGGIARRFEFLGVAAEFGANLVLPKPFAIEKLLAAVRRLIPDAEPFQVPS